MLRWNSLGERFCFFMQMTNYLVNNSLKIHFVRQDISVTAMERITITNLNIILLNMVYKYLFYL